MYNENYKKKRDKMQLFFYFFSGTPEIELMRGEQVIVIGHSSLKGHLVVERNNHTIHVPFRYLELKKPL